MDGFVVGRRGGGGRGGRGGGGARFGGGGGAGVRSFSGRGGPGFRRFGGRGHHGGHRGWRRWGGYGGYWPGYAWGYYPQAYIQPAAAPSRLAVNAEAFAALLDNVAQALLVDGRPDGAVDSLGAILKYAGLWGYNAACAGTRMAAPPPTSRAAGQIARLLAGEIRISISDNSAPEILAAICRTRALAHTTWNKLRLAGYQGTGAIL